MHLLPLSWLDPEYGYREFQEPHVELELVRWLEARAWVSAESHMALFDRAADQLVAAKVLLPGASVLWRLVGTVRQRAQERSWSLIAGGLTGEEHRRLLTLLTVPADATETGLERLRWGPVKPTADGMVGTLLRLRELRALSPALTGIAELPVARLRALLVDARTVRSQQIAQMSELRRLATLTAFCAIGERSAQDDVLDHLETILDEVDDRARARERKRRLAIAAVLGP